MPAAMTERTRADAIGNFSSHGTTGIEMRKALSIVLWWVAAGCDVYRTAAIAVAPTPVDRADSVETAAFAVMTRLATGQGLEPYEPRGPEKELNWRKCFTSYVSLCGKVLDSEVQFRMVQQGRGPLTPAADSLRRTLLSNLRAVFGHDKVRECEWEGQRNQARSGCLPLAKRRSTWNGGR